MPNQEVISAPPQTRLHGHSLIWQVLIFLQTVATERKGVPTAMKGISIATETLELLKARIDGRTRKITPAEDSALDTAFADAKCEVPIQMDTVARQHILYWDLLGDGKQEAALRTVAEQMSTAALGIDPKTACYPNGLLTQRLRLSPEWWARMDWHNPKKLAANELTTRLEAAKATYYYPTMDDVEYALSQLDVCRPPASASKARHNLGESSLAGAARAGKGSVKFEAPAAPW